MKNHESLLATLLVGITCALIGHCLAGCDGSGTPGLEQPDSGAVGGAAGQVGTGGSAGGGVGTDGGLSRSEAGFVSCPVPSPTGDQPGAYGDQARDTPYFEVVSGDVAAACRSFVETTLSRGYLGDPLTDPLNRYVLTADDKKALGGVDCSDASHDFQGTSGSAWCLNVASQDGTGACSDFTGKQVCKVVGVWYMKTISTPHSTPMTRLDRTYGVCSTPGVFAGWVCR